MKNFINPESALAEFHKHEDGATLVWRSSVIGEIVANPSGVKTLHVTRVLKGAVIFRLLSEDLHTAESEIRKAAGQNIILPVNVPYEVEVTALENGLCEVRCDYDRDGEKEIEHLEVPE